MVTIEGIQTGLLILSARYLMKYNPALLFGKTRQCLLRLFPNSAKRDFDIFSRKYSIYQATGDRQRAVGWYHTKALLMIFTPSNLIKTLF